MTRKPITYQVFAVSVVLIVCAGIGVWASLIFSRAHITIKTDPAGGEIWVDNKGYSSPASVYLLQGSYDVWAIQDGYLPLSKTVIARRGQSQNVILTLEVDPNQPPEGAPL